MENYILDFDEYKKVARQAVAEGQVLLRNRQNVLPLAKHTKVAVFGRMQFHYYKSGTGSGGMVNAPKVSGILDALLASKDVKVHDKLLRTYRNWEKDHPLNEGIGWGNEPWSQEEMSVSLDLVQETAKDTDTAIIVIGRTAGEDQDNYDGPGSYRLSEIEEDMMGKVRMYFSKLIVILNVGNIINMSFMDHFEPDAVLYAWQGGEIGGLGTVDVLTGKVNPSGKLTDTIAYEVEDYPSHSNFGHQEQDFYEEDIYVGYRYFETVAKNRVRFPFGHGLSYTKFDIKASDVVRGTNQIELSVTVTNIGDCAGKEVVQIYVSAPQGELGKPDKVLVAYEKTNLLNPGESQTIKFIIPLYRFASYDDSGASGCKYCYILEKGVYIFYAGNSVRDTQMAGQLNLEFTEIITKLSNTLAPVQNFQRIRPEKGEDGTYNLQMEEVPARTITPMERRSNRLPMMIFDIGDQGYKLADVKSGKVNMDAFIAQLSDEDLSCIIRGEGMGSPKVTPGTAGAFGGVSNRLREFGIPCACCSDGPSGMRLDTGVRAFSLPNGTLLACTFNQKLIEELYTFTGIEMVKNKVDVLLAPGMNIHRHPLNGRNFEYFSEDPLVTGLTAAAVLKGLQDVGVTGCVKHFCANNQEMKRYDINSIVSERALREIYLKGFEIVVREGSANAVMTTYGAVNGIWTAGNYELNTGILRDEWGFEGIVMTDWWAKINEEGQKANTTNFAAMIRSQNDLYMVCHDASTNSTGDNTLKSLEEGTLTRGELQRSAINICRFLMGTHAFERLTQKEEEETNVKVVHDDAPDEEFHGEVIYYKMNDSVTIDIDEIDTSKGSSYVFALDVGVLGNYKIEITGQSTLSELAQIPVTIFYQSIPVSVVTFHNTAKEEETLERNILLRNKYVVIRLMFGQSGLKLSKIKLTLLEAEETK